MKNEELEEKKQIFSLSEKDQCFSVDSLLRILPAHLLEGVSPEEQSLQAFAALENYDSPNCGEAIWKRTKNKWVKEITKHGCNFLPVVVWGIVLEYYNALEPISKQDPEAHRTNVIEKLKATCTLMIGIAPTIPYEERIDLLKELNKLNIEELNKLLLISTSAISLCSQASGAEQPGPLTLLALAHALEAKSFYQDSTNPRHRVDFFTYAEFLADNSTAHAHLKEALPEQKASTQELLQGKTSTLRQLTMFAARKCPFLLTEEFVSFLHGMCVSCGYDPWRKPRRPTPETWGYEYGDLCETLSRLNFQLEARGDLISNNDGSYIIRMDKEKSDMLSNFQENELFLVFLYPFMKPTGDGPYTAFAHELQKKILKISIGKETEKVDQLIKDIRFMRIQYKNTPKKSFLSMLDNLTAKLSEHSSEKLQKMLLEIPIDKELELELNSGPEYLAELFSLIRKRINSSSTQEEIDEIKEGLRMLCSQEEADVLIKLCTQDLDEDSWEGLLTPDNFNAEFSEDDNEDSSEPTTSPRLGP